MDEACATIQATQHTAQSCKATNAAEVAMVTMPIIQMLFWHTNNQAAL